MLVVFVAVQQAGMNHYVALTGSPDGWNIAYYIFTFFRGILFFTVIVLIGTGWSYMKVRWLHHPPCRQHCWTCSWHLSLDHQRSMG